MGKFEEISHTADVGIKVEGESLEDLFQTAAKGMFSLITDLDKVQPQITKEIVVEGEDLEDLLVRWLNELLYLHFQGMVFKDFRIKKLERKFLQAEAKGEKISPSHSLNLEIKAATYHGLQIQKDPPRTTIIFDV